LGEFHICLGFSADSPVLGFLPNRLRAEADRRAYGVDASLIHCHPLREIARQLALRVGCKRLIANERGWASVDQVYHTLARDVARSLSSGGRARCVYAYEDGAFEIFEAAERRGCVRVYDLPIAYWETLRRLIQEERDRLPEWATTLGGGLSDSQAKLERKTRELELAEMVVTPGGFVADSLPDWARNKVVVQSPFGSPPPLTSEVAAAAEQSRRARAASGQPLRVLFAGSMGQRKGLGDLMAAVRALGRRDVELVVMGSLQAEPGFYQAQCPGFRHEAGRPHAQVLELMRSCDVFCLPSIVEGRALVMQEAMSQGLPLIITANTGGADLVQSDGESVAVVAAETAGATRSSTGFLVPIRAPEVIAEAIAWCADHRVATVELGRAARIKAAAYTWEAYGNKVVGEIGSLLAGG
jgi:glycosyltransferase involved in cell wall biosynthesis